MQKSESDNKSSESTPVTAERVGLHGPSALMMPYSCLYFDEGGDQIPKWQLKGARGIHKFKKRYPKAKVYWGSWGNYIELLNEKDGYTILEDIKRRKGCLLSLRNSSVTCMRRILSSLMNLLRRLLRVPTKNSQNGLKTKITSKSTTTSTGGKDEKRL